MGGFLLKSMAVGLAHKITWRLRSARSAAERQKHDLEAAPISGN
jgi:hypothetical protein